MKKRLLALLLVLVLLIPAGVASAATRYRVNTSSLQVRQMPSESAKVLVSYQLDFVLTIQSKTGDGWAYVKFATGKEGYVQTKYIKKATTGTGWIASDNTALRAGPLGDSFAIATLAKGRKVSVLSWGSKYSYVNAGDLGTGYVVNSLLSRKKVAASGNSSKSNGASGGNYDAWVLNAGYRKVNLRSQPNSKAPIIASYSTGTKVRVLEHSATWDKIQVDGNTGYMMTKFLSKSAPAPTDEPVVTDPPATNYTAYVVSSNGNGVNMRKGPGNYSVITKVPYGSAVTVLKHDTKWDKISYGGKTGYMENRFLQLSLPAGVPEGGTPATAAPTAAPQFQPYTATITSPNGKAVNVHYKPDKSTSNVHGMGNNGRLEVGTVVTVIGLTGYWAEVEYGGKTGFVMQQYLN